MGNLCCYVSFERDVLKKKTFRHIHNKDNLKNKIIFDLISSWPLEVWN